MPQRFLRPAIRNSQRWNSVEWLEQSLYIRILTLVDDFGRYDGRASVIHGESFSIWNELHPNKPVTIKDICSALQQLVASQLVEIYEVDGKKVLQVTQWQERIRTGVREKWPAKPILQQVAASCSILLPSSPSLSPSPSPSPITNTPKKVVPAANPEHQAFIQGWVDNFRAAHGFDYSFDGGRDGKAVKALLGMGILRLDLLEIAKQAWERNKVHPRENFYCRQSITIAGFKTCFNQIRSELNGKNGSLETPKVRNAI